MLFLARHVAHSCTLSSQEMGARGSGGQGLLWLHSKFEVSLGYMKLCLSKSSSYYTVAYGCVCVRGNSNYKLFQVL